MGKSMNCGSAVFSTLSIQEIRKKGCLILFLFLTTFSFAQISISFTTQEPSCKGLPTGSITAEVSGGAGGYSYAWSTGQTTPTISNIKAGTYALTVTDDNNETASASVTLGEPGEIEVSISAEACAEPMVITAEVSGGAGGPYTYRWKSGERTSSITVTESGQYCVTVTDANSCGRIKCITVEATPVDVNLTVENTSCPEASDGSISVSTMGGVAPLSYLWSNGDTTRLIDNLSAGDYSVTITDANNCSVSGSATVDSPPELVALFGITQPVCEDDNNGEISVFAGGGTPGYEILWNTGETTSTISNLAAGTYIVSITDANGCAIQDTAVLSSVSEMSINIESVDESCPGQNDGIASAQAANGVGDYSYLWNTGDTTAVITDLEPGVYRVTATDEAGCQRIGFEIISEAAPLEINLDKTDVSTCGAADGTAKVTLEQGVTPVIIDWSTGASTDSIGNLGAGTYFVSVTDANECMIVDTVRISEPPAVAAFVDATANICPGSQSGAATAIVIGGTEPYTFVWNTGDSSQTIQNLDAGTYTVTLTDVNGCSSTASATINNYPLLGADLQITELVCGGRPEGAARVEASGGLEPYSYNWSTGESTSSIDGLGTGEYQVTVTDANGCSVELTGQVTVIDSIVIDAQVFPVNCAGESNGIISLSVSGGTGAYSYNWSNGSTDAILFDIPPGVYTVEVTDETQCSSMATFEVVEPDILSLDLFKRDVECGDLSTSMAGVRISGGVPPYAVNWSNGAETDTLFGIEEGVYEVTLTDANECMVTGSVEIFNPGAPVCNIVIDRQVSAPNAMDGALSATVSGGTAPYTYLWSNGETTSSVDSIGTQTTSLTITDALGCETTCSISLSELVENGLIGDCVWFDADGDGIQDSTEQGVADIPIIITPIETNDPFSTDTLYTDERGKYLQIVPPGKYKLSIIVPDSFRLTLPNNGPDSLDSDFSRDMFMTDTIMISPGDADTTLDAGLVPIPEIALVESCDCLNNATHQDDGQFRGELLIVNGAVGDTWTIIDQSGVFDENSPDPPLSPVPLANGTSFTVKSGGPDFIFRHLEERGFNMVVSNGFDTLTIANTCFYPELSITNLPVDTLTICKNADPIVPEVISNAAGDVVLRINGEIVTEIDPASLGVGEHTLELELLPIDELECQGAFRYQIIVISSSCPSSVGDYVWFDEDRDGIQDPEETGLPDIKVILTSIDEVGNEIGQDTTFTDENGLYLFETFEGRYKLTFCAPIEYRFTMPNVGSTSEEMDSDVDRATMMTEVFFLPGGVDSLSFDAGLVLPPAPSSLPGCNCLNNATTADNGQFEQTIVVQGSPGDSWEVIRAVNAFDQQSPAPPATPLDLALGTTLTETSPGIFELLFKHLDGETYELSVSNGMDTLDYSETCSYPKIMGPDALADTLSVCLNDEPFVPEFSSTVPGDIFLSIDGNPVSQIDPTALGVGTYDLLISLAPNDDEECTAVRPIVLIITTENCPAKIGDYVWEDENENGIQDADEMGISGVEVRLASPDGAGGFVDVDVTLTDNAGRYCFVVPAGDYKLTFGKPSVHHIATLQNEGANDSLDSDIDPDMLMTDVFSIGDAEENLQFDAGFILPCINLDYPGLIGPDQMLCAPGQDPDPILELSPARGPDGEIEYLWMKSESNDDFSQGGFSAIPGATGRTYDPGPLERTTYFVRCTRILGCEDFLETNVVTVQVNNDARADIIADPVVCHQGITTLEVETVTENPEILWSFPGGIRYTNSDRFKKSIDIRFNSFGTYTIQVRVRENGCEVISYAQITATNSPTYCDEINFAVQAEAEAATREVRLEWKILNDGVDYSFDIERSSDGKSFTKVAEVIEPKVTKGGYKHYTYQEVSDKVGRNFYRVEMKTSSGASSMSNAVELMLFEPGTRVMIYPNPVQNELMLEFAEKQTEPVEIELVSAEGTVIQTMTWEGHTVQQGMDFSQLPGGLYFVRIKMSNESTEVIKVLKRE